ncbi:DnaD domain protein [Staphylococcus caprae]|uniref:DnaD domain protein n=1 Tax=Staphylococcus caprae TaxID=29380 RepID=UPI00287FB0A1|nr:DnaD domain protein [Staphylococcus caprae]
MSDRLVDITGGYGTVYKEVMKNNDLSIEAKAIYSYLTTYAGSKDIAFPSIKLICYELNISEKRFYKHRKELLDKNIISKHRERTENGFSKTIYTINHHFVHGQIVRVQNGHGQNGHGQNVGTKNNSFKNNSFKNNSDKTSRSFQYISNNLEMIQSPIKVQQLEYILNDFKDNQVDIVTVATDYCKENNKGINYLIKVLENWSKEGIDTKEKAIAKVKPKKPKDDDYLARKKKEMLGG